MECKPVAVSWTSARIRLLGLTLLFIGHLGYESLCFRAAQTGITQREQFDRNLTEGFQVILRNIRAFVLRKSIKKK